MQSDSSDSEDLDSNSIYTSYVSSEVENKINKKRDSVHPIITTEKLEEPRLKKRGTMGKKEIFIEAEKKSKENINIEDKIQNKIKDELSKQVQEHLDAISRADNNKGFNSSFGTKKTPERTSQRGDKSKTSPKKTKSKKDNKF